MTSPTENDPYIAKLRELSNEYHAARKQVDIIRKQLDSYIVHMRDEGYSYPVIAKNTRLAMGTIQNIVAKSETW